MNAVLNEKQHPYAQCVVASKRINWDIHRDVIRGRGFDYQRHFLPDGLSRADRLPFLNAADRRFFSQVQGRSYAYIFGLVERFINAKVLQLAQSRALGDQKEVEALVRFSNEELKHQEMFRLLDEEMERHMPKGYARTADPDGVAELVLAKSEWAVLGLTAHIEIFTQVHYRESIEPKSDICPLWKDVFLFHWKEESQHAILDELEWRRMDAGLSDAERDMGVSDLIDLVVAVDGLLQAQAKADAEYFLRNTEAIYDAQQKEQIADTLLSAYRFQYIVSGVQVKRFQDELFGKLNEQQTKKVLSALSGLLDAAK